MAKVLGIFLLLIVMSILSGCTSSNEVQNQREAQVQLQGEWGALPSPSPVGILNQGNSLGF